jgi:glycosyltransferase involved in cell wall biosynthesis
LNPLVSIVTPSYNQGRFIKETIESVLSQDYRPVEYLVFDGGSTDETREILQGYGDRFFWVSEKDKGQSNAINKGWGRARGEILAWLNSDDIYLPGAISKAVAFLQAHPEYGAVYGEGYHVEEDGKIIERYPTEPFDRKRLTETCYICQPTVFIRRAVLRGIGFLDEDLRYCMDYDLWFRIARRYDWGYLPEYLACTRFYGETKTLGQKVQVHREILALVCRHQGSVPASWVYGYGHALLEKRISRATPWGNALFILALIGVSLLKFLRYNHRVPLAEWKRWGGWFQNHFQWNKLRPKGHQ